jgi:hypothetical protein
LKIECLGYFVILTLNGVKGKNLSTYHKAIIGDNIFILRGADCNQHGRFLLPQEWQKEYPLLERG